MSLFALIVVVVIVSLAFDFVNGWHDAANAIATVVATRVLSPFQAVVLAAVLNLGGALVGTEVADTMSKIIHTNPDYIPTPQIALLIIIAGVVSASTWS